MLKRRISIAAAIVVACFLAAPTFAQTADCDSAVIDGAKLMSASGLAQAQASAKKFETLGSVRVRTIQDYGNAGNLDKYEANLVKTCPSWQAADGGTKNNLLVLMFEKAHSQVGFYFGGLLKPALDSQWQRIKDDVMKPIMRDGKFGEAFAKAIDETSTVIVAQRQVAQRGNAGPTTIINQAAADNSGATKVFAWIAGIVIGIIIVILALFFFGSRRKEQDARNTAQQAAQTAVAACSSAINSFDPTILKAKVRAAATVASGVDADAMKTELTSIERDQASASAEFATQSGIASNNPEQTGLSVEAYQQVAETFNAIKRKLEKNAERARTLQLRATSLEEAARNAPTRVTAAKDSVEKAQNTINGVAKQGFKVEEAGALLTEAITLLSQANDALAANKPGEAAAFAAAVEAKCTAATAAAGAGAEAKTSIDSSLKKVDGNIEATRSAIAASRNMLEEMAGLYAHSSWAEVENNAAIAEERFGKAVGCVKAAKIAANMEHQQWTEASAAIKDANRHLNAAKPLLDAVTTLHGELARAKAQVNARFDQTQTQIDTTAAYLTQHSNDLAPELSTELEVESRKLQGVREQLRRSHPDYLSTATVMAQVFTAADEIAKKAKQQHQKKERQREKKRQERKEAREGREERSGNGHDDDDFVVGALVGAVLSSNSRDNDDDRPQRRQNGSGDDSWSKPSSGSSGGSDSLGSSESGGGSDNLGSSDSDNDSKSSPSSGGGSDTL